MASAATEDSTRRLRRQELLGIARQQRHDFLEGCRGDGEKTKRFRSIRRECEYAVLEESCAGRFASGGRVIRFLSELIDEQGGGSATEALVPLAHVDGAEHELCSRVEARCPGDPSDAVDVLIERLKQPEAAEIVQSLQRFVYGFEHDASDESDGCAERIESFVRHCGSALRCRAPWCAMDDDGLDASLAALETMVYRCLHGEVFFVDEAADAQLDERLASLAFVGWEHLDVSAAPLAAGGAMQNNGWFDVLRLVRALDAAKSPADKCAELQAACRALAKLVSETAGGDEPAAPPGADDMLPALIMAVKAARPPRLASNAAFLARFGSRLRGERGYLVATFAAAVTFLRDVDAATLQISPEDFEAGVRASREKRAAQQRIERIQQRDVMADASWGDAQQPRPALQPARELSAREVRAMRLADQSAAAARTAPPAYYSAAAHERAEAPASALAARRFVGADAGLLTPAAVRDLLADYHALVARLDALQGNK
ncbi:hypothetical protein M885DRAFT_512826 [Pelagophyceae sp. CCMP2097]|nr:hypothetical protein M885DRAFT_512826 [Pelagophyceae sp. CCMP2097]